MERTIKTPPIEAVGCTIEGDQEANKVMPVKI
jgi:hypothetical protein